MVRVLVVELLNLFLDFLVLGGVFGCCGVTGGFVFQLLQLLLESFDFVQRLLDDLLELLDLLFALLFDAGDTLLPALDVLDLDGELVDHVLGDGLLLLQFLDFADVVVDDLVHRLILGQVVFHLVLQSLEHVGEHLLPALVVGESLVVGGDGADTVLENLKLFVDFLSLQPKLFVLLALVDLFQHRFELRPELVDGWSQLLHVQHHLVDGLPHIVESLVETRSAEVLSEVVEWSAEVSPHTAVEVVEN